MKSNNVLNFKMMSGCDFQKAKLFYTVHYNWAWVVQEALCRDTKTLPVDLLKLSCEYQMVDVMLCDRVKLLPSQRGLLRARKITYALFRAEFFLEDNMNSTYAAWANSTALAFLDPKDALYKYLRSSNAQSTMPPTTLISWDCKLESDIDNLPSCPALLKAALGSGGFGIYVVFSKKDILQVVQSHANFAKKDENFLKGLRRDYDGDIPSWSLQPLLNSIRIHNGFRCQIRIYVIACDHMMFMFLTQEVRIPQWEDNKDLHESSSPSPSYSLEHSNDHPISPEIIALHDEIEIFEAQCCGNSQAKPYNRNRKKSLTNRLLLDEVEELCPWKESLFQCVREAFLSLKPIIESKLSCNDLNSISNEADNTVKMSQLAIAGIDLILADTQSTQQEQCDTNLNNTSSNNSSEFQSDQNRYAPYILELNNNPAMPPTNKLMSERYRCHLVDFVQKTIRLGLSNGVEYDGFEKLW